MINFDGIDKFFNGFNKFYMKRVYIMSKYLKKESLNLADSIIHGK